MYIHEAEYLWSIMAAARQSSVGDDRDLARLNIEEIQSIAMFGDSPAIRRKATDAIRAALLAPNTGARIAAADALADLAARA